MTKIYTVKLPKNIREIDLNQFLEKEGRYSTRVAQHKDALYAFREILCEMGNTRMNVTMAREQLAEKFYLSKSAISKLTIPFVNYLANTAKIPPTPKAYSQPESYNAEVTLIQAFNSIEEELKAIRLAYQSGNERLRDLAIALRDGGHGGLKTAIDKLPWVRR